MLASVHPKLKSVQLEGGLDERLQSGAVGSHVGPRNPGWETKKEKVADFFSSTRPFTRGAQTLLFPLVQILWLALNET